MPLLALIVVGAGQPAGPGAADLTVTSVSPPNATVHAPILSITVHFDRPVNPASVTNASFWAFARTSGTVTGSFVFADGNATVTLVPDRPLFWGEPVTVLLSHALVAAQDGSPMRAGRGYAWRFTTRPAVAAFARGRGDDPDEHRPRVLDALRRQPLRHESRWLRRSGPYNEGTDDIRIFPNAANGTVAVGAIVEPGCQQATRRVLRTSPTSITTATPISSSETR